MSNLSKVIENLEPRELASVVIDEDIMEASVKITNSKESPVIVVNESGTDDKFGNRSEGLIPHFHIKKKGKYLPVAIRLDIAEYFTHNMYQETLNSCSELGKEYRKKIDNVLRKRYDENRTNWDYLVSAWNKYVDKDHRIPPDAEQPDYTKLEA